MNPTRKIKNIQSAANPVFKSIKKILTNRGLCRRERVTWLEGTKPNTQILGNWRGSPLAPWFILLPSTEAGATDPRELFGTSVPLPKETTNRAGELSVPPFVRLSSDLRRRLALELPPGEPVVFYTYQDPPPLSTAPIRISEKDNPPGGPVTNTPSFLLLDEIQDPGNMGTLLRTARAAGFQRIILYGGCAHPWSPRVLRSAAGHTDGLLFWRLESDQGEVLDNFAKEEFDIVATRADGAENLFKADFPRPVILMVGNEGRGLPVGLRERANRHVKIPMAPGSESLNAALAGGLCLFQIALRQKLISGDSND